MKKPLRIASPLTTSKVSELFKGDTQLIRQFEDFLNDRVSTAELARSGGELSQVPSFIPGIGKYNPDRITIDTYNKVKCNPQINAGLKVIKLPIVGQNWTVKCLDKDIADFVAQVMEPCWNELMNSTLTGIDYGFSAHEKVWQVKDLNLKRKDDNTSFFKGKAIIPKKFKSLYPHYINMETDDKDNLIGMVQTFLGKNVRIPASKSFIFTHDRGDSFGNLFGVSRLKPVYEVWYWWVSIMQFMLRYFERKGTPPVVVRFPSGKSRDGVEHSQTALAIGNSLISESVVALASSKYQGTGENKWGIEYLMDDKRGEMFINALTFLESKMLRGLFVPERTITQDTTSKSGSYSLSKVHADMFLLGEEALIVDIESHFNKYIIKELVQNNFGATAPGCNIRIERITDSRKVFYKDIFMEMVKTGTALPAAKQIAEAVGIPMEDKQPDGLDVLDQKTQPAKESPEKPAKEKRKFSETVSQRWRPVASHENEKVLADIEGTLDKRQEEFKTLLTTQVLDKQIVLVSKAVDRALSENDFLGDIWFKTVISSDPITGATVRTKTLWQPFRSKMLAMIKAYMKEFYLFGQTTAVEELKITASSKLDKEGNDLIRSRSVAIVDRYLSNLKYNTEILLLTPSNKTKEDLLSQLKRQIGDKMRKVHIEQISEQESMVMLNLGRKKIVDTYA